MRALRPLLAVAYPFLVFGALQGLEPRSVAVCFALVFAARALAGWRRPSVPELRRLLVPAAAVGGVLAGTALLNDPRFLFVVPTLMNAALLFVFGRTLLHDGPTFVETIARMQHPELPSEEVDYCRSVTRAWCVFFVANGATALWLALAGDPLAWTLYTGLVSYLLVGLVYSVEFVVRSWRFGRYGGTLVEPLFRRIFPHGPA